MEELINILKHKQCVRNKITKINTSNLFIPPKDDQEGKIRSKNTRNFGNAVLYYYVGIVVSVPGSNSHGSGVSLPTKSEFFTYILQSPRFY